MEVRNNEMEQRFEYGEYDDLGMLNYRMGDTGTFDLMHTEVPESMAGKGVGSKLVKAAFEYAKENNLPVRIYCSFVAGYVQRHKELMEQVYL